MKQALFLVTSINGLKKPSFINKIETLQSNDYEVAVLLAMTNFDEVYQSKKDIQNIWGNIDVEKIRITSLFDVFKSDTGVPLRDEEVIDDSIEGLIAHEMQVSKGRVKRFVTNTGDLRAESLFVDEALTHTILFDEAAQIVQINNYDHDQLFGIEKYRNGEIFESLLLNSQQELLFRFTETKVTKKVSYLLGTSAVIEAPAELVMNSDDDKKSIKTFESSIETSSIKVISYSDFKRYDNINAFYNRLLANMKLVDTEIYLDSVDMVDIAKYMPKQRIFNY
ncbi:hypothetical protein [Lentilactobacillus kosonis]|uniref:Uncharacterized protein n=1 Tax=Lentilactobacillus kosonis TaxID=2810561 RepID=A0A401FPX0_9LACO|nr:hypothetical protein [Lentilactobacillus kosonis]GAY74393.1 hypothetical protein NBRC111893_2539 [Lentilactobacillus kosonis]